MLEGGPCVRHAVTEDAPAVARIQVAGWRQAYRGVVPDSCLDSLHAEQREPLWRGFIENEDGSLLVAVPGGCVSGFCHVVDSRDRDKDDGHAAEVAAIYVHPGLWRRGLGSALMAEAIGSAAKRGKALLTLWVLERNAAGRGFYEKLGFKADGATKTGCIHGEDLVELRYSLVLKGGWV